VLRAAKPPAVLRTAKGGKRAQGRSFLFSHSPGILPINNDKATAHESSKLNAMSSGVKRKGDSRRTEAMLTSSYLE
jgi:hypothetical protein